MNTKRRTNGWLAAAGLTLSLAAPLTANAHFQSDDTTNLVIGAAATYALVNAVDDFDKDRDRDRNHRRDRRHDDGRPFNSRYRHGHGCRHGHHGGHGHGYRHAYRHAYRHGARRGYRHGRRYAHGYPGRTRAPYWYAHR